MEPDWASEADEAVASPPLARTLRLRARAQEIVRLELGRAVTIEVEVRRGEVVEQVLAALQASSADVLAFGFHRGGPPGGVEAGRTARRLAHTAPGAVLTVPL